MVDYMKLMIHHKHELKTVYFYTIVYTQRAATKICYKKKRFYMTSAAYCELHHFFLDILSMGHHCLSHQHKLFLYIILLATGVFKDYAYSFFFL